MVKGIYCNKCGTNNKVHQFKCSECHSFVRPVYPTLLGAAALLAIYFQWLLFMRTVVPVFASILSFHGAKFSLFVRVAIGAGQYFTGWGVIFGLLFVGVLIWLGLFWRPQRAFGRNLVITIVLAKAVGALVFSLLAVLDVLPFVAMK